MAIALLEDESAEGERDRRSFVHALTRQERTAQTRAIARAAARALVRDATSTSAMSESVHKKNLHAILDFTNDSALRADAPALPILVANQRLVSRAVPLSIEIPASDVGMIAATDAAPLPGGRVIVAMGEAGVRLLTRDGRVAAHFDQPAHRLVISDHGDRVIAMARRGEVWRLARIDLLTLKSEDWCEARVDAFDQTFDGSMWFIGAGEDFYAIDAMARRFDALWRVPDVEGDVISVARSSSRVRFLVSRWLLEEWEYEFPSMTLRNRTRAGTVPIGLNIAMTTCRAISVDGIIADQSETVRFEALGDSGHGIAHVDPSGKNRLRLFRNGELLRELEVSAEECNPLTPAINSEWVASAIVKQAGALVTLANVNHLMARLYVSLPETGDVSVRLSSEAMMVADARGRVLVIDLETGKLMRDLRLV
jgi:hypothetical protein